METLTKLDALKLAKEAAFILIVFFAGFMLGIPGTFPEDCVEWHLCPQALLPQYAWPIYLTLSALILYALIAGAVAQAEHMQHHADLGLPPPGSEEA